MVNLSSVDLNRLLVLHAVLEERSVTRAASRLHVTPSAISNSLAELRATLRDPLFVRRGRGLTPTPRAVELAPELASAVAAIGRVIEGGAAFEPEKSARTFTLACSDAEQIAAGPRIAAAVARALPRARLRLLSVEQLALEGGLGSAEIDAAIGPQHPPTSGHYARDLYREEGVLIVRRDHPRVGRRMSKELFNELRHVDILLAGDKGGVGHRMVERFFASHGLARDVAVSAPSFAAAAAIAAATDWVTGAPRRLAAAFLEQMPLKSVSLPIPPIPFRIQLMWHERTHVDPGARFFRSLVYDAVRSVER